jgi:hypothetical protein
VWGGGPRECPGGGNSRSLNSQILLKPNDGYRDAHERGDAQRQGLLCQVGWREEGSAGSYAESGRAGSKKFLADSGGQEIGEEEGGEEEEGIGC